MDSTWTMVYEELVQLETVDDVDSGRALDYGYDGAGKHFDERDTGGAWRGAHNGRLGRAGVALPDDGSGGWRVPCPARNARGFRGAWVGRVPKFVENENGVSCR